MKQAERLVFIFRINCFRQKEVVLIVDRFESKLQLLLLSRLDLLVRHCLFAWQLFRLERASQFSFG